MERWKMGKEKVERQRFNKHRYCTLCKSKAMLDKSRKNEDRNLWWPYLHIQYIVFILVQGIFFWHGNYLFRTTKISTKLIPHTVGLVLISIIFLEKHTVRCISFSTLESSIIFPLFYFLPIGRTLSVICQLYMFSFLFSFLLDILQFAK